MSPGITPETKRMTNPHSIRAPYAFFNPFTTSGAQDVEERGGRAAPVVSEHTSAPMVGKHTSLADG